MLLLAVSCCLALGFAAAQEWETTAGLPTTTKMILDEKCYDQCWDDLKAAVKARGKEGACDGYGKLKPCVLACYGGDILYYHMLNESGEVMAKLESMCAVQPSHGSQRRDFSSARFRSSAAQQSVGRRRREIKDDIESLALQLCDDAMRQLNEFGDMWKVDRSEENH